MNPQFKGVKYMVPKPKASKPLTYELIEDQYGTPGRAMHDMVRLRAMIVRVFSNCVFAHADPVKAILDGKLHFVCGTCQADFGEVLPGLTFTARHARRKPLNEGRRWPSPTLS